MTTPSGADTYLAIVSKRDVSDYTEQPLSDEAVDRILQAGRATGSARNRQEWLFYVVRNRRLLDQLAETVSAGNNVRRCQLAVVIVLTAPRQFDLGRVAQNMMLAAWADGIGSCPTRVTDQDTVRSLLGLAPEHETPFLLTFGYSATIRRPKDQDPNAVLARIDRKSLSELVRRFD
jgi:nitroreductase